MTITEIPKEAQQYLQQLQLQNQQLQNILIQKQSVALQLAEIGKALEELRKVTKEDVFKAVGPILIKTEKAPITKELKERKDSLDLQLKKLEEMETRMKKSMKVAQEKISQLVPTAGSA